MPCVRWYVGDSESASSCTLAFIMRGEVSAYAATLRWCVVTIVDTSAFVRKMLQYRPRQCRTLFGVRACAEFVQQHERL